MIGQVNSDSGNCLQVPAARTGEINRGRIVAYLVDNKTRGSLIHMTYPTGQLGWQSLAR